MSDPVAAAVDEVARASYGRLVAYLASVTGDIAAAEDALGDALEAALRTWPSRGIPERPESWLVTAARRTIIDAARRRETARRSLHDIVRVIDERAQREPLGAVPDERLRLMFACAHPAIAPAMRSPLILQAVLGLDAARLSESFLVPATTMGQRLVRAKAKIKATGIPFRVPDRPELAQRLESVLEAVYAAYGTGWDDVDGHDAARRDLVDESIRLARLLTDLLPEEPETHGLLALLLHSHARRGARRDDAGDYVPLDAHDVGRWSRELIVEAEDHLATALSVGRIGPYQLQAAIQSVHNLRAATGSTNWQAVVQLYDGLVQLAPTTGTAVARAAAHHRVDGPDVALRLLDALAEEGATAVAAYQPYWVLRALCEGELGRASAGDSARRAVELTPSPQVAAYLRRTLPGLPAPP